MRNLKNLPHKTMNLLLTILLVILIMATPALADVVANSVGSLQIIDRSIKAVDIAAGAIKTKKIAAGAVNSSKIRDGSIQAVDLAAGSVNSSKIADGTITNADVAAGAAIAASKINRSGLDADMVDGKHASDLVAKSGDTMTGPLTASNFAYGSPQTRHLSIPGTAFAAEDDAIQYDKWSGEYFYFVYGGTYGTAYAQAPVQLPDGATVVNVRFQAWDNYGAADAFLGMWKWSNGVTELIADATTDGLDDPSWRNFDDATISSPVIDNSNANYFVEFGADDAASTNIRLGGVIITYTVPAP